MAKKNSRPNLAARKSASKKAEELKIAQQKAYWKANKKKILTIAAIAVAAIVLLSIAIDYLYVPSNTIRTFMGKPIDVKENALIREMDGHYYEFGTVDQPAGYEVDTEAMNLLSDETESAFNFVAAEEGKAIKNVYVVGVEKRTAADMVSSIALTFNYEDQTETKVETIGGHEVHYFYGKSIPDSDNEDIYAASITSYIDAFEGSSVLVSLTSERGAIDELPTVEEMLAEADAIYSCVKVAK